MREQKGITLIALVITIIVLLILAGVTIAMLTGQNGILTNANKSSSSNAYYGADEQMRLAYMTVRTQIMAETVANSAYDPTLSAQTSGTGENAVAINNSAGNNNNFGELIKAVQKDLGFDTLDVAGGTYSKGGITWTVTPETAGTGEAAGTRVITIKYDDNKIYAGTVQAANATTSTVAIPKTNGTVTGKITVKKASGGKAQTATYAFDQ